MEPTSQYYPGPTPVHWYYIHCLCMVTLMATFGITGFRHLQFKVFCDFKVSCVVSAHQRTPFIIHFSVPSVFMYDHSQSYTYIYISIVPIIIISSLFHNDLTMNNQ